VSTKVALTAAVITTVVLAAPAAAQQPNRAEQRTIELVVGQQTVIPAAGVDKFSTGNSDAASVRLSPDGSEFFVVGRAPGTTSLLLLIEDGKQIRYTIRVSDFVVDRRDNIRLDFYFVQISDLSTYRIGVGWPGSVAATVNVSAEQNLSTGTTLATASIVTEALPQLDFAQQQGWARVLRHASVVMANWETGRFSSGGEENFRIESGLSSNIQAVTFGSDITVRAHYDKNSGRIEVKVAADVSSLTPAGSDGIPGRTITQLDTLVNLELGQAIILAGLHAENSAKAKSGIPLLSQIPVIGALFGVHDSVAQKTENLVFIVPTIMEAVSLEDRDLIRDSFRAYLDFSGAVRFGTLFSLEGDTEAQQ
jgi:pilus assembly protein CpaC